MDTVEIVIGEDGLVKEPRGVRLRIPQTRVVPNDTDEDRRARLLEFIEETKRIMKDVPVKEVCESDPFIAKFKRMGILDERA